MPGLPHANGAPWPVTNAFRRRYRPEIIDARSELTEARGKVQEDYVKPSAGQGRLAARPGKGVLRT
jgi:hypothetical protein